VPFYGLAVLCSDNPVVQSIAPEVHKRFVTYGLGNQAHYRARHVRYEGMRTTYVAWRRAEELGEITISLPGVHNVLNSLAVLAVCEHLGVPFATTAQGLAGFEGIQRRFTVRGEVGGITIVDDFGHHPAEVRATLAGARAAFPGRRIVAAFQPHRYTRTRDQFDEFGRAFADCDVLLLCDVFAAGEKPIEGVSSAALARAVEATGHAQVKYIPRREDLAPYLGQLLERGDMLITLGAGDIQLTCNEVIEVLEATREPAVIKNLARR
jgi:UDP-N-acetylmuramate--alanine ligase